MKFQSAFIRIKTKEEIVHKTDMLSTIACTSRTFAGEILEFIVNLSKWNDRLFLVARMQCAYC
jgi:hypothetical protein